MTVFEAKTYINGTGTLYFEQQFVIKNLGLVLDLDWNRIQQSTVPGSGFSASRSETLKVENCCI
jgi:hypothetical protein